MCEGNAKLPGNIEQEARVVVRRRWRQKPEIVAMTERFQGATETDRLAALLMQVWGDVDPESNVAQHPTSYVATFADMARVAIAWAELRPASPATMEAVTEDEARAVTTIDYLAQSTTMSHAQVLAALNAIRPATREAVALAIYKAREMDIDYPASDDPITLRMADALLAAFTITEKGAGS